LNDPEVTMNIGAKSAPVADRSRWLLSLIPAAGCRPCPWRCPWSCLWHRARARARVRTRTRTRD